ncbi:hypothetical protein M514_00818 [Trichuris suis]|uniref:LIM zinc-binding domain-containing protein n=1 Tax=Trichuris suis TaxID=68888 RepID=A0A085MLF9_9BILA|nr:hypothetical protein M513_00818 [Trichuris suis]KFD62882.1 hypothetical protein M514_00818 [Trichuris suis]
MILPVKVIQNSSYNSMDAEELIKHDRDTKQWLADIESFRRPPPVKKLTEEIGNDMRDIASLDFHAKNAEEDFLAKLRKFQLSDSHPYSGNDRVQTSKQLTTAAKVSDFGMLSLASTCKRKERISKHQAKALREEITRLTRPTNPYSSPRSDSSGYGRSSPLCTFTKLGDESARGRTSFDHVNCSSCCLHDEFSKEYCTKSAVECHLAHPITRSPSRHESTRYATAATAPITEKGQLSSDKHQNTMADKEMSPFMGAASDFSCSHTSASRNSQSIADVPCSGRAQCHLCYMQDGLEDGLQRGSSKRPSVALSTEYLVSLNKRNVVVPSCSSLHEKTFYESNLHFCCKEDYMYSGYREFAKKCHSCGNLILAMLLQAGGKCFHPQCFRCCKCKACLDGVPFTVDSQGQFFCIQDYHTLFAPKCAKCQAPITPVPGAEETVRVVAMQRDYHIDCYVCEGCGVQLTDEPDKRCYPLEEHLLCQSCNLCWTLTGGTANPITDV